MNVQRSRTAAAAAESLKGCLGTLQISPQRSQEGKSEKNHIRCNKFITTCTNLKKIRIFKAFYDKYNILKGTEYLKKVI